MIIVDQSLKPSIDRVFAGRIPFSRCRSFRAAPITAMFGEKQMDGGVNNMLRA